MIGAVNRTHGRTRTAEYRSWQAAKERCYSPGHVGYPSYGGRGIKMCDEWRNSFAQFYADMGPCPAGHSIERLDFNGDYTPGNCVWATQAQQSKNRKNTVYVLFRGERITAREAADRFGFSFNTARKYRDRSIDHLPHG